MKVNRNSRRNKLLVLTLIAVLGSGLAVYLFGDSGPFVHFWKIDLSFLLLPILVLFFVFIISAAIPLMFVTQYTFPSSIAVQYSALTVCTYLVLQRLTLFSRVPLLAQHIETLSIFASASLFLSICWLGIGLYRLSSILTVSKPHSPSFQPFLAMLGFVILGLSLWKSLDIFSHYWTALKGIGFVIGLSLIILALTRLAGYVTSPLTSLVGDALKWGLKYPAKLFFLTIIVMCYFVFARPMIYAISAFAYLIEWVLICAVGYQILNLIKNHLKNHHSQPLRENYWKKHYQIVNEIADDDFNKMIILQQEFIESGIRRNLLLFLRQLLLNNGVQESLINGTLQPVIEYNDAKRKWYHRWFFKNRLSQHNRYRRNQVMQDSMDQIRTIIYPSRKYVQGAKK